jgi:hypothetical protein
LREVERAPSDPKDLALLNAINRKGSIRVTPMTINEANELLEKLDDLIFKAETGQLQTSWDDYCALRDKAKELSVGLAQAVSKASGKSYEEFYKLQEERRAFRKLTAMQDLHRQRKPDFVPSPEEHDLLKKFYDDEGRTGEERGQLMVQFNTKVYGYLFENAPRPPGSGKSQQRGILSRFFRS